MIIRTTVCNNCHKRIGTDPVATLEPSIIPDEEILAKFSYGKDQNKVLGSYEWLNFCNKECLERMIGNMRVEYLEFKVLSAIYVNSNVKVYQEEE